MNSKSVTESSSCCASTDSEFEDTFKEKVCNETKYSLCREEGKSEGRAEGCMDGMSDGIGEGISESCEFVGCQVLLVGLLVTFD